MENIRKSYEENEFAKAVNLYLEKKQKQNEEKIEEIEDEEPMEIWNGVKVDSENCFPMPTYCLKDKEYDARAYGVLTMFSHGSEKIMQYDKTRYVYENSMDVKEIANSLRINKTTLERNIKKLAKLECNVVSVESTRNGIVYRLRYGIQSKKNENEVNKFITINQKMLRELICSFDGNAIKIYCVLCYMCNEKDFVILREDWLVSQIGLCSKSEKNQTNIRTIIKTLQKCKYIETKKKYIYIWDEKKEKKVLNRIDKSYRICSFEEWNELDKKVE